jgi:hypothetical protein
MESKHPCLIYHDILCLRNLMIVGKNCGGPHFIKGYLCNCLEHLFLLANKVSTTVFNVSNFVFTPLDAEMLFFTFYARKGLTQLTWREGNTRSIISDSAAGVFKFDKEH